jgi:hypothetical protein
LELIGVNLGLVGIVCFLTFEVFLEEVEGLLLWWSKHKRQFSTIA